MPNFKQPSKPPPVPPSHPLRGVEPDVAKVNPRSPEKDVHPPLNRPNGSTKPSTVPSPSPASFDDLPIEAIDILLQGPSPETKTKLRAASEETASLRVASSPPQPAAPVERKTFPVPDSPSLPPIRSLADPLPLDPGRGAWPTEDPSSTLSWMPKTLELPGAHIRQHLVFLIVPATIVVVLVVYVLYAAPFCHPLRWLLKQCCCCCRSRPKADSEDIVNQALAKYEARLYESVSKLRADRQREKEERRLRRRQATESEDDASPEYYREERTEKQQEPDESSQKKKDPVPRFGYLRELGQRISTFGSGWSRPRARVSPPPTPRAPSPPRPPPPPSAWVPPPSYSPASASLSPSGFQLSTLRVRRPHST